MREREIKDYYNILGISYYATTKEIRNAYKNLVKVTHPDMVQGSSEKFKLIQEAYEVLSDDEKRKRYDYILFNVTKVNVLANKDTKDNYKKEINQQKKPPSSGQVLSFIAFISLILIGFLIIYMNNLFLDKNTANLDEKKTLGNSVSNVTLETKENHLSSFIQGIRPEYEQYRLAFNEFEIAFNEKDYSRATDLMADLDASIELLIDKMNSYELTGEEEEVRSRILWEVAGIGRSLKVSFSNLLPRASHNGLIASKLDGEMSMLKSSDKVIDTYYQKYFK
jgi:curved DNA-binding protein CbpA